MDPIALPLLIALIGVALAFDFLNGLHDAANSIATIVSTRVLKPQYAVVWAAFFNFIAFLFFGLHVATTVGKGIVDAAIRFCCSFSATSIAAKRSSRAHCSALGANARASQSRAAPSSSSISASATLLFHCSREAGFFLFAPLRLCVRF